MKSVFSITYSPTMVRHDLTDERKTSSIAELKAPISASRRLSDCPFPKGVRAAMQVIASFLKESLRILSNTFSERKGSALTESTPASAGRSSASRLTPTVMLRISRTRDESFFSRSFRSL